MKKNQFSTHLRYHFCNIFRYSDLFTYLPQQENYKISVLLTNENLKKVYDNSIFINNNCKKYCSSIKMIPPKNKLNQNKLNGRIVNKKI
jgi:hypothetical protein